MARRRALSEYLSSRARRRATARATRIAIKKALRPTEFPKPRYWGSLIWFVKSFEVLIFAFLETFKIYKSQKTIVVVPSIATRHSTSIQAVVYNGTQEEVLGFKPRRWFHKMFKGLPDLESFERLRFTLEVPGRALTRIDGSTESRGFLHLQVPWPLPTHSGEKASLQVAPLGVETFCGRIRLGDYFIHTSPVYFMNKKVKWVLLSDIDDTIKESNIRETTTWAQILRSILKGNYYTYRAVEGMPELYRNLAEQGVMIVYLTSTPFQLAPFLLKFLRESGFPEGPVFLRWLGYNRFGHKMRVLHRLLSQTDDQKFILIGDSGEHDLAIYRRIAENPDYGSRVAKVLIRHVPGTPSQSISTPREGVYDTIDELHRILGQAVETQMSPV